MASKAARLTITLSLVCLLTAQSQGQDAAPIEVGIVEWQRDFQQSLKASGETQKPVFALFQEVPGCEGCQRFGKEVLSHTLMVEAIEAEFIPVLIYNNRDSGTDADLLQRFNEPAWNYQVVRFFDAGAEDLLPRKDKVWTVNALSERMIAALQAADRPVPKYLTTIAGSTGDDKLDQAAFAMHCFWTGEYELGAIEGVISTEAGFLEGREVTLVTYDPDQISLPQLAKRAGQLECADQIYTPEGMVIEGLDTRVLDDSYRAAPESDQKRQLQRWAELRALPGLNAMQLTKLNSFVPRNMDTALEWLSPNQRRHAAESR